MNYLFVGHLHVAGGESNVMSCRAQIIITQVHDQMNHCHDVKKDLINIRQNKHVILT